MKMALKGAVIEEKTEGWWSGSNSRVPALLFY
jgi:hypothetical protein